MFKFGFNLPTLSMGMGLAGDIFGGVSNWSAAQRQRDLYKKQLEIQGILRDPNQVLAGASPYYQANLAALQKSMPEMIRQTVAPQLGLRGIDPSSGYGQLVTQQAIAPYFLNAQQQAQQQYINALTGGQAGLGYAGQNAGMIGGVGSNTANALRSIMLMQALQRGQPSSAPSSSATMSPYTGGYFSQPYAQDLSADDMTTGQLLNYQYPMPQFDGY